MLSTAYLDTELIGQHGVCERQAPVILFIHVVSNRVIADEFSRKPSGLPRRSDDWDEVVAGIPFVGPNLAIEDVRLERKDALAHEVGKRLPNGDTAREFPVAVLFILEGANRGEGRLIGALLAFPKPELASRPLALKSRALPFSFTHAYSSATSAG